MANANDRHEQLGLSDSIDDAIVGAADAKEVAVILEPLAARRPRLVREFVD